MTVRWSLIGSDRLDHVPAARGAAESDIDKPCPCVRRQDWSTRSRVRIVCATIRYSCISVMQMYLELLYRMVEFGSTDTASLCEGSNIKHQYSLHAGKPHSSFY